MTADYSELRAAAELKPGRLSAMMLAALDELAALRAKPKRKKAAPVDDAMFPGVDGQIIADFKAVRAKKRAPITRTSMEGLQREATKAGITLEEAMRVCCERSWQSLRADWIAEERTVKTINAAPWWTSDALIIAKGVEVGLASLPGEGMVTFKGRIQARIDGVEPVREMSRVTTIRQDEPKRFRPDGPRLASLIKHRESA